MAQADTSMAIADSITEQYAGVMVDLIQDCTRLEDKNADLQRQLAVALQVRDAAIVARDQARRERDEARADAGEGGVGDVDLRSYCECCDRYWHRNYVTWFEHPVTTDTGRTVSSACGACFEHVPELDPVAMPEDEWSDDYDRAAIEARSEYYLKAAEIKATSGYNPMLMRELLPSAEYADDIPTRLGIFVTLRSFSVWTAMSTATSTAASTSGDAGGDAAVPVGDSNVSLSA